MPDALWDFAQSDFSKAGMDLRIQELLDERKLHQTDLAAHLGVEPSTVSRWCSGEKRPRKERLHQIAAYFGVHPLELFNASVLSKRERRLLVLARFLTDDDVDVIESLADSLRRRRGTPAEE